MAEKETKPIKLPAKMVLTSEDRRVEIDTPVVLLVTKKEDKAK